MHFELNLNEACSKQGLCYIMLIVRDVPVLLCKPGRGEKETFQWGSVLRYERQLETNA